MDALLFVWLPMLAVGAFLGLLLALMAGVLPVSLKAIGVACALVALAGGLVWLHTDFPRPCALMRNVP